MKKSAGDLLSGAFLRLDAPGKIPYHGVNDIFSMNDIFRRRFL